MLKSGEVAGEHEDSLNSKEQLMSWVMKTMHGGSVMIKSAKELDEMKKTFSWIVLYFDSQKKQN